MSSLMTDELRARIQQQFEQLDKSVQIIFFKQAHASHASIAQQQLLEAIANLSEKIALSVYALESTQALAYRVDKVPATLIVADKDYGIRFYGVSSGYEFDSLIEAILLVSIGNSFVDPVVNTLAATITEPTHILVMVTLACPYCPKLVRIVHQLAFVNEHVQADMIDSSEFPQLIQRYSVQGVPLAIVNGKRAFEGALPTDQVLLEILKLVDPLAYERLEAKLREAQGVRLAYDADSSSVYDVIVVGAGPAGLAAALYAQRKGRKTLLIAKQAGGQVNDTASIENYLGSMQLAGVELAQAMRVHVEAYPVAERCHSQVTKIELQNDLFVVHTDTQQRYSGHSLIYCTGKYYRRLNIPGEARFIGHGVAWCATCDAPLYKDKEVAVVGGGNSAFTAVRDLLHYAKRVYLIHALKDFQADAVLIEQIKQAVKTGRVLIYLEKKIQSYLGSESLQGLRLTDTKGNASFDLKVDGVFLEIGLEPNSALLANLVPLNHKQEISVNPDQSTVVAGLFAAGDVTNEPEKQIIVAAAAGAKAALAVDRYLSSIGVELNASASNA